MKSPFDNMDLAMMPFWTDSVLITTSDNLTQTLPVSVFDDIEEEPLSDDMIDTSRRRIVIVARDADWCFVEKVKRGDSVKWLNNAQIEDSEYSVVEVKNDPKIGIVIRARQK